MHVYRCDFHLLLYRLDITLFEINKTSVFEKKMYIDVSHNMGRAQFMCLCMNHWKTYLRHDFK